MHISSHRINVSQDAFSVCRTHAPRDPSTSDIWPVSVRLRFRQAVPRHFPIATRHGHLHASSARDSVYRSNKQEDQRSAHEQPFLQDSQLHGAHSEPGRGGQLHRNVDATSNLLGVLLQATTAQVIAQIQTTVEQVRQTTTKLTKGLRPRPAGYPPGPSGDSAASMLLDPLSFLEQVSSTYQPIVGLIMGGQEVILVADPAAAQQVLIDKAAIYRKEGTAFFPGSSLAGNGLLVSDGAVWQRQRQLTNPGFRKAAVETYASAMCAATEHMLAEVWAQGGIRDVYADFNELTLNITTNALFGVDMSSSQAAGISEAVRVAFEFFSQRAALGFAIPEWLPTPDNLQYHSAVSRLDSAVYGIIQDRQQRLPTAHTPSSTQSQCLLDNLLMSKDENNEGLSMQSLRDQLMTLLVAGQETSAILLGWTTAFLAHYPEIQAQAAAEIQQVLQGQAPTSDSIRQLPYLEAVVLETLRLRPPAYIVGRCAAEGDELAGFHVQAGTTILVSPYIMHRSEQSWQDPQEFKPTRWHQYQQHRSNNTTATGRSSSTVSSNTVSSSSSSSSISNSSISNSSQGTHSNGSKAYVAASEQSIAMNTHDAPAASEAEPASSGRQANSPGSVPKQGLRPGSVNILSGMGPNGAYIPFGAGPRNCIGTGFAMMEAMLVTAAALQKFTFEPSSPSEDMPQAQPRITLRPAAVRLLLKHW